MMLIGIDPHKSTHTATAVAPETNRGIASTRIEVTLLEYQRMLEWASQWPQRRGAVENAGGMGGHVTSWLLARGEQAADVSPVAAARIGQLPRGGGRKKRPHRRRRGGRGRFARRRPAVRPEEATNALALLGERRTNISPATGRAANQLRALLRALLPGGAPGDLSAAKAGHLLGTISPVGVAERSRHQLAADLVAGLRALEAQLKANAKAAGALVVKTGSPLTKVRGIGPVTAGRLPGRTGNASRFPAPAACAHYTGTAPVEIASAGHTRYRLSRRGDRQLNAALHTIAIT